MGRAPRSVKSFASSSPARTCPPSARSTPCWIATAWSTIGAGGEDARPGPRFHGPRNRLRQALTQHHGAIHARVWAELDVLFNCRFGEHRNDLFKTCVLE